MKEHPFQTGRFQASLGAPGLSRFLGAPKPPYLASNTIAFENLLLLLAFKSSRWSCAGRRHAEPTAAKTSLGAIAMYMCGGGISPPVLVPGFRFPLQVLCFFLSLNCAKSKPFPKPHAP